MAISSRRARLSRLAGALAIVVAAGLAAWLEHDDLYARWQYVTVKRPYMMSQVRPFVPTAAQEQALKPGESFRECAADAGKDYCPQMVVLPAGSFLMGSPPSETGSRDVERPQHSVTIAKSFAVAKHELTFDEWNTCVANGDCTWRPFDAGWGRGQQPVIYVSWDDAKRYVAWLAKVTGKPYRLLSESEYEYAARAGMTTAYPWGNDIGKNNANCNGCGSKWDNQQTARVGSLAPNQFGLYDMVGNVFEWVEDCMHPSYNGAPADGSAWIEGGNCDVRIVRGGSWDYTPVDLRSANRNGDTSYTGGRSSNLGFRVGRTLIAH
jgi:formylglycine-generating enzyme required for sulfatase activity